MMMASNDDWWWQMKEVNKIWLKCSDEQWQLKIVDRRSTLIEDHRWVMNEDDQGTMMINEKWWWLMIKMIMVFQVYAMANKAKSSLRREIHLHVQSSISIVELTFINMFINCFSIHNVSIDESRITSKQHSLILYSPNWGF